MAKKKQVTSDIEAAKTTIDALKQMYKDAPPIIEPSLVCNGEKHLLQEMFEDGEMPEMKAIGYAKIGGKWLSYVVTFQGDKVLKIYVDEPNEKAIAEESAKLHFVQHLVDVEPV